MIKKLMLVLMLGVAMVGCSKVTVPPASKGKILSASGYSTDVKETGKYWLSYWEDMVLLDTSTQTIAEQLEVKMADDLTLKLQVRVRTRISSKESAINAMFNDIKHNNYQVTLPMVYAVYGRDSVQSISRSVLSKYRVPEVSNNFDRITDELSAALAKAWANSPLELSNVTMGSLDYPDVIDAAINKQSEREMAIQTETNDQAVKMVQKTNELKLAQADYEVRMTRAKALRDENELTSAGLSPMLLQYRQLEVLEQMTKNNNAVFIPYESLTSAGMQNRIYSK